MPAETQTETKHSSFLSEEKDDADSSAKPVKERKPLSPLRVVLIIVLCVLFLIGGMFVRRRTSIMMEHRVRVGYLNVDEFALVDPATGKPEQSVRTLKYDNRYHSYLDHPDYVTSRGIGKDSTWEEFVTAYGDCTIYDVYIYPIDDAGKTLYDKSVYINEEMTLNEFHERYVLTGEYTPQKNIINVQFYAATDGIHLYYGADELSNARRSYSDEPDITHPLAKYLDYSSFYLEFRFGPDTKNGGEPHLKYIGSSFFPSYMWF